MAFQPGDLFGDVGFVQIEEHLADEKLVIGLDLELFRRQLAVEPFPGVFRDLGGQGLDLAEKVLEEGRPGRQVVFERLAFTLTHGDEVFPRRLQRGGEGRRKFGRVPRFRRGRDDAGQAQQLLHVDLGRQSRLAADIGGRLDQFGQQRGVDVDRRDGVAPEHHLDAHRSPADESTDLLPDKTFHAAQFGGKRAAQFQLLAVDARKLHREEKRSVVLSFGLAESGHAAHVKLLSRDPR